MTFMGCGGGDGSGGAGGSGGSGGSGAITARYQAPASTPVDVGAIPFPSDLFIDANGKVAIGAFPSTLASDFEAALRDAWPSMDGWGMSTGAFFFLSGGDVTAASVAGTIHVYDLATGDEVPVTVGYNDKRHSIGAIPSGQVFAEKHAYGAVLVHPGVQADADFAAIRGATSAPSDARLAKAWTSVKPVLDAAAAKGVAANTVVAATAWHTTASVSVLEKMRMFTDSNIVSVGSILHVITVAEMATYLGTPTTAEEGMDQPGSTTAHAAQHSHLGAVVHANIDLKSFTGTTPTDIGLIQFDASGAPMPKATFTVPFTITLPAITSTCTSYANLPLILFIPGVKHARADLFAIADGYGAKCAAVAGVDLPFHGSRTPMGMDTHNNVTGALMPDYIGDVAGVNGPIYFFNIGGGSASVKAWDPRALRDTLRQAATEQMALIRTLTDSTKLGTLRAVTTPDLSQLSFRSDVAMVGHSLGSYVTAIVAAVDPHVKVVVLDATGGGIYIPTLTDAPWFGEGQTGFVEFFSRGFGIAGEFSDGVRESRFHPSLAFYQGVVDAADPFGFARYIVNDTSHRGNTPVHVWLNSYHLDNTVPNQASEPLGAAIGLTRITLSTSNPMLQFASMNSTAAPYTGSNGVTAGYVRMATTPNNAMFGVGPSHATIYWTHDTYQNMPPYPPFVDVTLFPVDDPTRQYHRALEDFVMDFFAGNVPSINDPYTYP